MTSIVTFVSESNRIEGIHRDPTVAEVCATEEFVALGKIDIGDLVALLAVLQPDAIMRSRKGLNVRVGSHIAPPGGREIRSSLSGILWHAMSGRHPYHVHCAYETLHPFTDGNGRTGRALWLWQMVNQRDGAPLGFLHHFYYQALEFSGDRT